MLMALGFISSAISFLKHFNNLYIKDMHSYTETARFKVEFD